VDYLAPWSTSKGMSGYTAVSRFEKAIQLPDATRRADEIRKIAIEAKNNGLNYMELLTIAKGKVTSERNRKARASK
jgi:hypothetical protein